MWSGIQNNMHGSCWWHALCTSLKRKLTYLSFFLLMFLSFLTSSTWTLRRLIYCSLFIMVLFWLTKNNTTCSSLCYYREQVGTACRPTSVSGRPPLFETISFIITKCVIISFGTPLTRVCLRALLKLTAGHFIVFLADQESFWGALFQRENWRVAPVGG